MDKSQLLARAKELNVPTTKKVRELFEYSNYDFDEDRCGVVATLKNLREFVKTLEDVPEDAMILAHDDDANTFCVTWTEERAEEDIQMHVDKVQSAIDKKTEDRRQLFEKLKKEFDK